MTGDEADPRDNIVLIGMMAAGKSTLGVLAAERLNREFVDADQVLEDEAGMPIPEIFRRHGEAEFRRREFDVIRRIVRRPGRHVVATGGGAFCQGDVREFLLGNALTVFLRVGEAELLRRLALANPDDRPMLAGDWRARVGELVRFRYPLYGKAHLAIDIADEPPAATLERLLAALAENVPLEDRAC